MYNLSYDKWIIRKIPHRKSIFQGEKMDNQQNRPIRKKPSIRFYLPYALLAVLLAVVLWYAFRPTVTIKNAL